MIDNWVHVYSVCYVRDIGVWSPPIGNNVRSRQNVSLSKWLKRLCSAILNFDHEASPWCTFCSTKDPVAFMPMTAMILAMEVFSFVNFDNSGRTICIKASDLYWVVADVGSTFFTTKIGPVNCRLSTIDGRFVYTDIQWQIRAPAVLVHVPDWISVPNMWTNSTMIFC